MDGNSLVPGAVFQPDWDERPIRVLAFDGVEVLYDSWWPHKQSWGLATLTGNATYYRLSTALLLSRARLLRSEPLTEAENQVHRPDLPLRVCRSGNLRWEPSVPEDLDIFEQEVAVKDPGFPREILALSSLILNPFGIKGGRKRGVLVKSADGIRFTSQELLWQASKIQAAMQASPLNGVGIYRSGFQNRIPSYYLWGSQDKAGIVSE